MGTATKRTTPRRDADPYAGAASDVVEAAARVAKVVGKNRSIDAEAVEVRQLRAAVGRHDTLQAGRGDVVGAARSFLAAIAETGAVSKADAPFLSGLAPALEQAGVEVDVAGDDEDPTDG